MGVSPREYAEACRLKTLKQGLRRLPTVTDAILDGATLLSPAEEGIHSVELANSILLSSWTGRAVELPMNGAVYEAALNEKIATSKPKAKPTVQAIADLSKSVV